MYPPRIQDWKDKTLCKTHPIFDVSLLGGRVKRKKQTTFGAVRLLSIPSTVGLIPSTERMKRQREENATDRVPEVVIGPSPGSPFAGHRRYSGPDGRHRAGAAEGKLLTMLELSGTSNHRCDGCSWSSSCCSQG